MHFEKVQRGSYFRTERTGDSRVGHSIRRDRLEQNMLDFLTDADWKNIAGARESDELKGAQAELETVLSAVDETTQRITRMSAAMDDETNIDTIRVLAEKIAKQQKLLATLTEQREALQTKINAERAQCEALYDPQQLLDLIESTGHLDAKTSAEIFDLRSRLKMEIRERVSRIDVDFTVKEHDGVKYQEATVTFRNEHKGVIIFPM
jgi:hypothetical protein